MKHRKLWAALLMMVGFVLPGCDFFYEVSSSIPKITLTTSNPTVTPAMSAPHEHTFKSEWSYDMEYHWHDATCGHSEIADKGDHCFGDWRVGTYPTRSTPGSYISSCLVCGFTRKKEFDYEEYEEMWYPPEYTWSEDYCFCTATRQFVDDPDKTETETVESELILQEDPTCDEPGGLLYFAEFKHPAFEDQHLWVPIPELGDLWGEPTYEWSDDYRTCYAQRTCLRDGNHYEQERVNSTYEVIVEPTFDDGGLGRYTATFSSRCFTTQIHDVVLPVKPEVYPGLHFLLTESETGSYFRVEASKYDVVFPKNLVIPGIYKKMPVKGVLYQGFAGHKEIETVTILGGVVFLEPYAFADCTSLESVVLPEGFEDIYVGAFSGCTALSSINIPESIQTISGTAFRNCPALSANVYDNGCYFGFHDNPYHFMIRSISMDVASCAISPDCKFIGSQIFCDCFNLESVTFPKETSICTIPSGFCWDCTSLKSVNIPEGITSIDFYAFMNCYSLPSITFPASLNEIGNHAFFGCEALEDITYLGTKEQWSQIVAKWEVWSDAFMNAPATVVHCSDGDFPIEKTSEE